MGFSKGIFILYNNKFILEEILCGLQIIGKDYEILILQTAKVLSSGEIIYL